MAKFRRLYLAAVFFALFIQAIFAPAAHAEKVSDALGRIISKLPSKNSIAVSLFSVDTGRTLYEHRADVPMKPASVLKLLTAFTTLKKFGAEFKFPTKLYGEGRRGSTLNKLYVQGWGDPSFTTESMWILTRQLKKLGISKVEKVIFDDGAFEQRPQRSGQRAFETSPSALPFNFNSIALEVCPSDVGQPAIVTPDPWDLPFKLNGSVKTSSEAGFVVSLDEVPAGQGQTFSVRGRIGVSEPCKAVYRSIEEPTNYFAASFMAFAKMSGVHMPSTPAFGEVPEAAHLLHVFSSKPLSLIVQDMNHFSTNFIGEQLLFSLGENESQNALSRERGLAYMSKMIETFGFTADEFELHDGSGLSHDNRISARIIARILKAAEADESMRPEYEASLSVAGSNGTLKKRTFSPILLVLRGKTGTINGVNTLAGYLNRKSAGRVGFVIFQNRDVSRDDALALEDQIVEAIYQSE